MMKKYTAKYAKVVRSQSRLKKGGGDRGMPVQLEVCESVRKAVQYGGHGHDKTVSYDEVGPKLTSKAIKEKTTKLNKIHY